MIPMDDWRLIAKSIKAKAEADGVDIWDALSDLMAVAYSAGLVGVETMTDLLVFMEGFKDAANRVRGGKVVAKA
ncbi:MAG: hypothetical protein ACYTFQ_24880 [Planctomycetota bacterium]